MTADFMTGLCSSALFASLQFSATLDAARILGAMKVTERFLWIKHLTAFIVHQP